jgi:hypothetical protein
VKNGETFAAIAFYLGVAALVVGAMLAARGAIEKRGVGVDRRVIGLIAGGFLGIGVAVAIFATGPHGVLPF